MILRSGFKLKQNKKVIGNFLKTISYIFLSQIVLSLLFLTILKTHLLSFALGGWIAYLNFVVLTVLWNLIIFKKRVAPPLIIVVIKYGILIYLFLKIPQINWINQNDLVYGILMNPAAVILGGFFLKDKKADN